MIVFSAFTPHSPLLLPSIGKENVDQLSQTQEAMEYLAEELYASMPDTIVVISAHTDRHDDAFSINLHDPYGIDLTEFGDYSDDHTFRPNAKLIDRLQRHARKQDMALTLNSNEALDYGTAVPLLLLTEKLPNINVVPISYSDLDAKTHVEFGRVLKDVLMQADERIAVIASGDLSHCLSSEAPVEYNPLGETFDDTVKEAIKDVATSKLLTMEEETIESASECAYEPLLILFGVLDRMNVESRILSYEAPFGVGYLVARFSML
jgi:aromatic ring-opening dioxygenase LigB subunit